MAGIDGGGAGGGGGDAVDGAAGTAELTRRIREAGDALERAMRGPNASHFAPQTEALRADCLELFRQLLLRSPYSAHRKDAVSKMWFRLVYPCIGQYRANIRQLEAVVAARDSRSPSGGSSPNSQAPAASGAAEARQELARWRARLLAFLQATAGTLQRLVAELVATHALTPAASGGGGSIQALDPRTLAAHKFGFELALGLPSELQPGLTPTQRATLAILARLLSHLGDLARYRVLYVPGRRPGSDPWQPAKELYRSAIRLAPHRGQAHNQLAVIHGYEHNTLDGVFAYYRALTAQHRFTPADANLRTVLDAAVRSDAARPEQRLYAGFVHLRYLFALSPPPPPAAANDRSSSRPAPLAPADEARVAHEVKIASEAFVQAVAAASAPPAAHDVLVAHAIHLLELQQLSCLAAEAIVGPHPNDPVVARLSADLVAAIANALAAAMRGSIAAAVRRPARPNSGASAMLDAAARRGVPLLVLTLTWLVSVCLRVARDYGVAGAHLAKGARPVPPLHAGVFRAVRASGLLRTLRALGCAMADAQKRTHRRPAPEKPPAWKDALRSTDTLAAHMWGDAGAHGGPDDGLLAGWQLPDGTVWGWGPLEPDAEQQLPSAPAAANDDAGVAQWRQLHWLLTVALEALPLLLAAIDASEVAAPAATQQQQQQRTPAGHNSDQDSCATDTEQEPETICYRGRPPPPAAAVAVTEQQQQPPPQRSMPTPLVDAEHDEVVCAATAATMRAQHARGAIGSHRAGAVVARSSSSSASSAAGGRAWRPLDQQSATELYSAQTVLAPGAPPAQEYGMSAINAWQQYQAEQQRKLELEQQLAHQHWIQIELQQQLLAQHQQQYMPLPQLVRAAQSFDMGSYAALSTTTSGEAPASYRQYSAMYNRTPTGSGVASPDPPPLW
ncbi:hypothetical protein H4R19_001864 [Coemansia spiralis]|nr:hypothetical protein H4R19_001864 [Coemansia spiralis]